MLYAIAAVLVIIADQLLKYWVTVNITLDTGSKTLIPGVVSLVNIHNTGAAFGILQGARWLFILIAAVFIAVVVFALVKGIIKAPLGRWSAVGVLAGAVGNCIDRVMNGYVVDMFHLEFLGSSRLNAIFNLADMFISICGILFCIYIIFGKDSGEAKPAPTEGPSGRSRRRPPEDDDGSEEELPRRRRPVTDSEEEPPRRRRPASDSEEEPPRRRRPTTDSDEEPPRRRRPVTDSEEEPPRRRRPAPDSEEEAPRRRRPAEENAQPAESESARRPAAQSPVNYATQSAQTRAAARKPDEEQSRSDDPFAAWDRMTAAKTAESSREKSAPRQQPGSQAAFTDWPAASASAPVAAKPAPARAETADPFSAWDSKSGAAKTSFDPFAEWEGSSAAKPAAAKPAAAKPAAAPAPAAPAPAPAPAKKPSSSEEYSLDDIMAEFR